MPYKALVGILVLAILGYGAFEALPLIEGPALTVESPIEGALVTDGALTIEGKVRRAQELTVNGASLLPDEEGYFMSTLALPAGTSILTFAASDRFGRRVSETRIVYVSYPATTTRTNQ